MTIIQFAKKITNIKRHPDIIYVFNFSRFKIYEQIQLMFFSFLFIWYLANNSTKVFFGNYQLIMAVLGILFIFTYPGTRTSILQSVANGYNYSLIVGTRISFSFSLVGSLVLIILGLYYFIFRNSVSFLIIFILLSVVFPFYFSTQNYKKYLEGKKQFKQAFNYNLIFNITRFAVLIITLSFFELEFTEFIIILLSFITLLHISFYVLTATKIKDRIVDTQIRKYSTFMSKLAILSIFVSFIDQLIVGIFLGVTILSIYAIGVFFPEQFVVMFQPLFSSFIPGFIEGSMRVTHRKIYVLVLFGIILSVASFLAFPIILGLFFPEFPDSIILSQLFSLVFIFLFSNLYLDSYFKAIKYEKGLMNPIIVSRFIFLLLLIPFLLGFSLIGLVVLKIIQAVVKFSLSFLYFKRL